MKSSQKRKSAQVWENTRILYADNTEVIGLKITNLVTNYIIRFNGSEVKMARALHLKR